MLAREINHLGGKNVVPLKRGVQFEGDKALLYKANLELRTALRILQSTHEFTARNEDELYRKALKINWEQYMGLEDTFAIDAVTHSKDFSHSKYAGLKLKDAIADWFRKKYSKRPNVNIKVPTVRFHLHINEQDCSISLDSSGRSLHQRGYRIQTVDAPINEVLAAGLILLSGYDGKSTFIDPMCGSGTLPIEAALFAYQIPPQLSNQQFAFQKWADYDQQLWENVLNEAKQKIKTEGPDIYGSDKNLAAFKKAQINASAAQVEDKIYFQKSTFEKLTPPPPPGTLITNPPYDERLKSNDPEKFYKSIGDHLKQAYAGFNAWIISSNMEAIKSIGLKPSKKHTLFNGALECKYHGYELYQGSKKRTKSTS